MKNRYEIRGKETAIFLETSKLHGPMETLIDTVDLPDLVGINVSWYPHQDPHMKKFYVVGSFKKSDGKYTSIKLHRVITYCPVGLVVDHINHDTLDNRRSVNLRVVTNAQNKQNPGMQRNNTSGVRGVSRHRNKWEARFYVDGKRFWVGSFLTLEEAEAALKKARSIHMPFFQN